MAPKDCLVALSILDQLLVPTVPIAGSDWDSERSLCLSDFNLNSTLSCVELEWTPAGIQVEGGMTIEAGVGSGPFVAEQALDDEEPSLRFELFDARSLAFHALPGSEGLVSGDFGRVGELDVGCDTFSARLAFGSSGTGDSEAAPSIWVAGGTGWLEVEVPTLGEGQFRVPSIRLGLRIDRSAVCPGSDSGAEL